MGKSTPFLSYRCWGNEGEIMVRMHFVRWVHIVVITGLLVFGNPAGTVFAE